MLWTLSVVLTVLWLLGIVSSAFSGHIHVVLLAAVCILLFGLLPRRRLID
jgi:putative exporter of polyketide antibiotics